MRIGFIGLGNVGRKLAGSILRNGFDLIVRDLNIELVDKFTKMGAKSATNAAQVALNSDVIITCLPHPSISAEVMEGKNGILSELSEGKIWLEMSTTDESEVKRLGKKVRSLGAEAVDCPVSGGCHRAATGNISIFAGCERDTFDKILPLLSTIGRRILHTGPLGSASILKVLTNYLATANLLTCTEALTVAKGAGMDLKTTFEAIRISSGTSFVHETESQVILNGSRDISFTMGLVHKDILLFQKIADNANIPLEMNPLMVSIFEDGISRYGADELSPNIIKRLEEKTGLDITALGFPDEMVDDEPEERGYEVKPHSG